MADETASTLPDNSVTITAQRKAGVWTFQALPPSGAVDEQPLTLGTGPSGAGVMFPLSLLDQLVANQGGS